MGDCCQMVWNYFISKIFSLWGWLKVMIESPTVIAAIIAFVFAPWVGITTFLRQQRISRVQKIYYEESLLEQLNHLDNVVDITNQNLAYFENAVNLIDIEMSSTNITGGSASQFTAESLRVIAKEIIAPVMYQSSKKEIIITLFKTYGYIIHKWLYKFDNDFRFFNLHLREIISILSSRMYSDGFRNRLGGANRLQVQTQEVNNYYAMLMRHQTLIYLFNRIVTRIGILDFKSSKSLIYNVMKDEEINDSLKKFDEVYKILFGYYKLENKLILSYLTDEEGKRFKLHIQGDNKVLIEHVDYQYNLDNAEMKIVFNDISLAGVMLDISGVQRLYSWVQVGMANLNAFHEKPQYYPEVASFTDLLSQGKRSQES